MFIVARSSHESSEQKILKAGANRVITPNVIGGRRMAGMVMQPVVSDYLDLVAHGEGVEFRLQEYSVAAGPQLLGKTLSEAQGARGDRRVRSRGAQRRRAYRRESRQRASLLGGRSRRGAGHVEQLQAFAASPRGVRRGRDAASSSPMTAPVVGYASDRCVYRSERLRRPS